MNGRRPPTWWIGKVCPMPMPPPTPTHLFLMATNDYLKISGDTRLHREHWEACRAWKFETSHDSDGDGIYENTEGSGWVESWPPGMPHQEIYLAALDQQASTAMAEPGARHRARRHRAAGRSQRAAKSARPSRRNTCCPAGAFTLSAATPMAARTRAQPSFPPLRPGMAAYRLPHANRCSIAGRAGVFDRLGHARPEPNGFVLRSHQLSPGHGVAALHGLGFASRNIATAAASPGTPT